MEGDGGTQLHKRHQQRKSKAERKKSRRREKNGETKHNPRAFTFSGGVVSVQRKVQRSLDKRALKEKEEKTDKTPDVPPPYIVVVQGPPGVRQLAMSVSSQSSVYLMCRVHNGHIVGYGHLFGHVHHSLFRMFRACFLICLFLSLQIYTGVWNVRYTSTHI